MTVSYQLGPGGATRNSATSHRGYYFNPFGFGLATVQLGRPIPSAHDPIDIAGGSGTDIGNLGRNVLRAPHQSNVDCSLVKLPDSRVENRKFRADFLSLFNQANRNNPVGDISAVTATHGSESDEL